MRCNRRQLNGIKDWEMLHYQKMIITRQEERKRALFNVSIIIYSFIFWSLLSPVSPDMESSRLVQYEGGRGGGEEEEEKKHISIFQHNRNQPPLTSFNNVESWFKGSGASKNELLSSPPGRHPPHTPPLMPFMVTWWYYSHISTPCHTLCF